MSIDNGGPIDSKPDRLRRYELEYRVLTLGDAFTIYLDITAWTAEDAKTQGNVEIRRRVLDELDRRPADRRRAGYDRVQFCTLEAIHPWSAERILERQSMEMLTNVNR